jgi:nitrite reductase/ring-hydroxylating ferredoxin subunit
MLDPLSRSGPKPIAAARPGLYCPSAVIQEGKRHDLYGPRLPERRSGKASYKLRAVVTGADFRAGESRPRKYDSSLGWQRASPFSEDTWLRGETMTEFLPDESDVHRRLKEIVEKDGSENPPCHHRWSSTNYTSTEAFATESKLRAPICLGPAQRLLERSSYFLSEACGKSWIVRRTGDTQYAAHLNRCRHRGMKLVENESGNASKIVCPYHGWTYDEQGVCVAVAQKAAGKVPPETPAFQPYRGKPAVRNVRGDRGNVGIIRSPVRASILPDWQQPRL